MDDLEAAELLLHCAAFDNRKPSVAASKAWAEALQDIPADVDAFAAIARFYAEIDETSEADIDDKRWIQPHNVRKIRRLIRAERIPDGAFTYPALDHDETGAEFVQRRRAQIRAIADGRIEAEPIQAIKGGPHPSVAKTVARIGQVPEHLRPDLVAAGIGAKREQWPELAIPCPLHACRARASHPCRTPTDRRMTQGTHWSRQEAWKKAQDPNVVTEPGPQEAS
jgi:hypothetical protein